MARHDIETRRLVRIAQILMVVGGMTAMIVYVALDLIAPVVVLAFVLAILIPSIRTAAEVHGSDVVSHVRDGPWYRLYSPSRIGDALIEQSPPRDIRSMHLLRNQLEHFPSAAVYVFIIVLSVVGTVILLRGDGIGVAFLIAAALGSYYKGWKFVRLMRLLRDGRLVEAPVSCIRVTGRYGLRKWSIVESRGFDDPISVAVDAEALNQLIDDHERLRVQVLLDRDRGGFDMVLGIRGECPIDDADEGTHDRDKPVCPSCRWKPDASMTWPCACGFEAEELVEIEDGCPECERWWIEIECPECDEWSPYEHWFFGPPSA